jgi:small subunit ribosomal protein S21
MSPAISDLPGPPALQTPKRGPYFVISSAITAVLMADAPGVGTSVRVGSLCPHLRGVAHEISRRCRRPSARIGRIGCRFSLFPHHDILTGAGGSSTTPVRPSRSRTRRSPPSPPRSPRERSGSKRWTSPIPRWPPTGAGRPRISGPDDPSHPAEAPLKIEVFDNQIEAALKSLKKQMLKDGVFQEMKRRAAYEKPSVKRKRKQAAARKKRRKALRRMERDSE